uniref:Uncharacterized protein n=1 Tax=Haliea sp. ETY-M TaxID=1055105 RepID=A0A455R063_9GAMM|nr:hypothetical protein [Haliea sp. ETY-M]
MYRGRLTIAGETVRVYGRLRTDTDGRPFIALQLHGAKPKRQKRKSPGTTGLDVSGSAAPIAQATDKIHVKPSD